MGFSDTFAVTGVVLVLAALATASMRKAKAAGRRRALKRPASGPCHRLTFSRCHR